MATARMNCPYGWPLEAAHKIQVCRKGDGSGNWRCGKGWKRLDGAPYCKPSKRARQQQATGTQGSPLFALSPPSLVVGSVLAETRPDFVCVNLDFWPDAKQCSQQDCVLFFSLGGRSAPDPPEIFAEDFRKQNPLEHPL